MSAKLDLPARPRILVVALRRLGDVLLTTPLIRSLRRAYPDARLELLVFADTAEILAGNPDIDAVITCPVRPSFGDSAALAWRMFRRYDLAKGTRGKYLSRARASFETILVDKKVVEALGGPEGLTAILTTLAKSVTQARKKRRVA